MILKNQIIKLLTLIFCWISAFTNIWKYRSRYILWNKITSKNLKIQQYLLNYIENESIEIDEDNKEDEDDYKNHWNFIIKKLLVVEGEKDEWVNIIESIDSK